MLGKHRWCTSMEAIDVIRQMASRFTDPHIAATLNRLGLRTGTGNNWTEGRVYSARHYHQLPAYDPGQHRDKLTLEEAAQRLGVSVSSVRRMIERKELPAGQVVACAPWEIPVEGLESEVARRKVENIKNGVHVPQTPACDRQHVIFSES